LVKV
jgi:hypothetical protein